MMSIKYTLKTTVVELKKKKKLLKRHTGHVITITNQSNTFQYHYWATTFCMVAFIFSMYLCLCPMVTVISESSYQSVGKVSSWLWMEKLCYYEWCEWWRKKKEFLGMILWWYKIVLCYKFSFQGKIFVLAKCDTIK